MAKKKNQKNRKSLRKSVDKGVNGWYYNQAVSETAKNKKLCTLKIKHCKKLKQNLSTSRKGLLRQRKLLTKDSI